MPVYQAPVDSVMFLLSEVLGYERYSNLPGFADAPLDVVDAVVTEAARFCEQDLQPLNRIGDQEGCTRHEDGSVTTPTGFKESYETYAQAGWAGLAIDQDFGGQGLPQTLGWVVSEFCSSANFSWSMVPGLSQGAAVALSRHGSAEQKALYLPKIASGVWAGTMNLTEPQCGTDLGLIRTTAVPADDGSYRISGEKIFISSGEHDLTENIVHLVLARIADAPAGTKGLSLFLVPKFLPDANGEPGRRNGVSCAALEDKMGIHGNPTCVMLYEEATAWLVGKANGGLRAMFTMMNEARLGVGVQGLAISEVAYQNAAHHARERRQGRALTGAKEPNEAADPILVHPDIRRILLSIRAFNEAARALVLWTALQSDVAERSPDAADRQAAHDHMGLLTPVVKGVLTDTGFENTVQAQQVYGGHGYIAEHGVEQFVRDARIAMLYEGANGVQALDLVGRKLPKDGGRAVMAFFGEVESFVKENAQNEALAPFVVPLTAGLDHLRQATMWFVENAMAKPDNAGAGSTDYMHLFGLVALGYMWGRIAKAAVEKLKDGANGRAEFYETRLTLGRVFMERAMPGTAVRLARISSGADALMALPAEAF